VNEIKVWWHGIAALPATRQDHAYYALRRVWDDHTMAGNRGFYRVGSEDHVTPALFQNWALFPDTNWVAALIGDAGGEAGRVSRVRWAYACEEILDAQLRPFHGRDFVIPDIMLTYEDENGPALLVFEVKKPGTAAEPADARKLTSYVDLPSMRTIKRRFGCLLVSQQVAEKSRQACAGKWPVLTWEHLSELQLAATSEMKLPITIRDQVSYWIKHHFSRYGVFRNVAPSQFNRLHGTYESYREIDALSAPDGVRLFLKGSECSEAALTGRQPDPPLPWLADEPNSEKIRQQRRQTKEERRVCRWNFDWTPAREQY